jgi:hypothetical protein
MTIPTRNCDNCAHQVWPKELGRMTCLKGHKPRYYLHKDYSQMRSQPPDSWGYKRKCADFQPTTKEATL